MLRMAGEVADGIHIHPLNTPTYLHETVMPDLAAGAERGGRSVGELEIIVPTFAAPGATSDEVQQWREMARMQVAFYGSTPNYAFIWDEAGFEGTTARVRERQKAGDFAGMAAEITDEHVSAFATEATWDTLADALVDKYGGIVDRLVLYSAADETPERFARYGEVARNIVASHPA
jgi:alkanesulfonate monooxygenase SsuD/methylene tetrahydromethanopterin reductase-like flavin-dependent oxidoreductase (luciferase family)